MIQGRPRLFPMCLSRSLFALFVLVMIGTALPSPASAGATPCPEGTTTGRVHLSENAVATVPYSNRTHEITVQMSGLNHRGIVAYDDNNDGIKERCVPSNGLGAFEFNVTFNPAVLTVEDASVGDDIESSGGTRNFQCQERRVDSSHYAFGCVSTGAGDGPQGSFDLATITLSLVGGGPGNLAVAASSAGPLGDDAAVVVQGGSSITVTGAPARPTDRPGESPTSQGPDRTDEADPDGDGTPGTNPTVSGTTTTSGTPATPDGTPAADKTPGPDGSNSDGGGGTSGSGNDASVASVMLWTLVGLGGVGAASALSFFALRWRGML